MPTWTPRANDLFLKALEMRSAGERQQYLDGACAEDAALRAEVESLLEASAQAGSFLESPPAELLSPLGGEGLEERGGVTVDEPPVSERPGTIIGPYKLLQQVGEGGMGTVFMAEQTHPVQRKVALKVIKAGMDSSQVIARFEAERQALALMDHPNIAKVLDAGTTDNGRPYFVMELVKGVPITKYCDEHRLTPKQRLELFVPVCQAVQHAHQKGIIHRDLKPSNVMVCLYDGKPVPKVIDFGVAKATGQKLTDRTLFTEIGQVVGTLEYMSPEQAELNQLDIDTRSDIYSLGVLLYELLTGSTPLERKRFKAAAMLEVLRLIREEEPPKPSTRLSTTDEMPSVAANRGLEPKKLSGLVRGELDWIVMKALEKDRNRRYETANAFAADVQRYLADEPVQACPPSASYRLRKFLRRNKGPMLGASTVVLLLVAGVAGTTTGLVRALAAERQALKERDQKDEALRQTVTERDAKEEARRQAVAAAEAEAQARRQTRQALNTMTDAVVEELLGRQVQLTDQHREFLKKVLAQHAAFAAAKADHPEGRQSRAEGYFRVGRIRYFLGELKDAESAYGDALALRKQLVAEFPTRPEFRHDLALSHHYLGMLLMDDTDRLKEAEAAYREAVTIGKQLAAEFPAPPEYRKDLAKSQSNLGVLSASRQPKEAEAAYRDALAINTQLAAEFPTRPEYRQGLAATQYNLGTLLSNTSRPKEAEAAWRDAVAINKQLAAEFGTRPEFRQDLAKSQIVLGVMLSATGPPKEAEAAWRDAVALLKQLAAEFPTRPDFRLELAASQNNLGNLLRNAGRLPEAEAAWRDGIALFKQLAADLPTRPEQRVNLALSYHNLGALLSDMDRPKEAEAAWRDAVVVGKQLVKEFPNRSDYSYQLALYHDHLGHQLRESGQPEEAEVAWRDALALYKPLAANQNMAFCHYNLGVALGTMGRLNEAIAECREAVRLYGEKGNTKAQEQLRQTELWARLDKRLPAVLQDKDQPKDASERLGFAQLCQLPYRRQYASAARFFGEAFAAEPKLAEDQQASHRYNAACSAALGGCGQGKDAAGLDEKERARLRRKALDWLRADLEAWGRLLDKARPLIVQNLRHWLADTDFAGVRGPEALAKLPEAERQPWRKLWGDIADMLKQAPTKTTPDKKSDAK